MPAQATPILKFKGLNSWLTLTSVSPDQAIDCMNVIPSGSGGLDKMRVPVVLSDIKPLAFGPARIFDYTSGTAALAQFGQAIYSYSIAAGGAMTGVVLAGTQPTSPNPFSMVELNTWEFMANGTDMLMLIGGVLVPWGFNQPAPPFELRTPGATTDPGIGNCRVISSISSDGGGEVTIVLADGLFVAVGDIVYASGVVGSVGNFNLPYVVDSVSADFRTVTAPGGPVSDSGTSGQLFAQTFYCNFTANQISSSAGIVTIQLNSILPTIHPFQPGDWFTISGTGTAFDGEHQLDSTSGSWMVYLQPGVVDYIFPGGTIGTPMSILSGRQWEQSRFSAVDMHYSIPSAPYAIGPQTVPDNRMVVLGVPIDAPLAAGGYSMFRTTDGGGDFYQDGQPVDDSVLMQAVMIFRDTSGDTGNEELDLEIQAPLLNYAPPVGKYLAPYQGRVYIFNLNDDSRQVAYSGYEQILVGNPPRSFPPNNRFKLQLGADPIRGGGVMEAGVVAFSESDRMYMQRGTVEDITVTVPVQFTSYLQELPWHIGLSSHESIASTPYGLCFLAGDLTIRLFDGSGPPQDVSGQAVPLLRSITPGQAINSDACYFRWLDRDWYALTVATGGSTVNNRIIFVDLTPIPETNGGIFVSNIQADSIQSVEDPNGTRLLVIGQGGQIKKLIVNSDATGGISLTPTSTSGTLAAWWQGGYEGSDSPQLWKMWRWAKLISDPPAAAAQWRLGFSMVDDEARTFQDPEIVPLAQQNAWFRFSIDRKAPRCSTLIQFPDKDMSCHVLSINRYWNPAGVR